jgi:DNA-binding CsgD family transcriptional regulator
MRPSNRSTDGPRVPPAPDPTRRRLTPREYEIAQLLADGLKDVVIANRLDLGLPTVRTYIRNIQAKLDVRGRNGIIAWMAMRRVPDHPEAGLRRIDGDAPR